MYICSPVFEHIFIYIVDTHIQTVYAFCAGESIEILFLGESNNTTVGKVKVKVCEYHLANVLKVYFNLTKILRKINQHLLKSK